MMKFGGMNSSNKKKVAQFCTTLCYILVTEFQRMTTQASPLFGNKIGMERSMILDAPDL